jgi:hypothetical protein
MAIDYICGKLEEFGFVVDTVQNLDVIIRITFKRSEDRGELRIDRMGKLFEICAVIGGETIFPVSGNWELIADYLLAVSRSEAGFQM